VLIGQTLIATNLVVLRQKRARCPLWKIFASGKKSLKTCHAPKPLIMVAQVWNRADHYISFCGFFMVALCNRADHYIFALWFLSSSSFFFFSSPKLSSWRLDVYHTSTHDVALVPI